MTEIRVCDDFDLDKLALSGQCFRWTGAAGGGYRIVHRDRCLTVRPAGPGRYRLNCDEAEFCDIWREYFDLDTDYRAIRRAVPEQEDPYLARACAHGAGIRILRQDPWETLVSFIVSQNRSIPMIQKSVDLLCAAAGDKLRDAEGGTFHAFPSPEQLRALDDERLRACRLGYRCAYVRAAAEAVASGALDLDRLCAAEEPEALAALMRVPGVGIKVANCVALFGLHHLDAFPVDVWMRRILAREYPNGYPLERYRPYNGVYQQYMFYSERIGGGEARDSREEAG
ncbi:MAG: DNA-3-methyladenine glycosylase 2 family protein [Oscillospiraceae bacterium]|nr:DNA-3-methyladenine glycosylase 2 family protein [Oscillospiraceae bacterium]